MESPISGVTVQSATEPKPPATLERGRVFLLAAGLLLLSIWLRRDGLNPSSLFHDDAWVAVMHRLSWNQFGDVDFTTTGFSAGLKAWLDVVGFSNLKIQLPIFVAAIALAPATFLVLRRKLHVVPALTAALLLAISPVHAEYAVRVKQYSIEAILTLVAIALAWEVIERPDIGRRWTRLAVFSMVAVITSFSMIFSVVPACAGAVASIATMERGSESMRALLESAGLTAIRRMVPLGIGVFFWFVLIVRPNLNDQLKNFWVDFYLPTDAGVRGFLSTLRILSIQMFEGFAPLPGALIAVLLGSAGIALLFRKPALTIVLAGPYLAMVLASTLERAPLGGLRTDIILYPTLAVLIATGLHELWVFATSRSQIVGAATGELLGVLAIGVICVGLLRVEPSPPYPVEDLAPLVAELDERWQEGDSLLLYYAGVYHYTVYSDVDFEIYTGPAPFGVTLDSPELVQMGSHRSDHELYRPYIADADELGDRMWFLVAHPCSCDISTITEMIRESERIPTWDEQLRGASLTLWENP